MDHVKEFNNYFPQGNAKFIVTKMQNLKTLSRKKKEIDSELTKKPGYFLLNKSFNNEEKLKEELGFQSNGEHDKKMRNSKFVRLDQSRSFFMKKPGKNRILWR